MDKNTNIHNAYFIASLQGKPKWENEYKAILNILESKVPNVCSPIKDMQPDDMKDFSEDDYRYYLINDQKLIKEADVVIAEVSTSSSNVGYEVGYAVANLKPVLLLRSEKQSESTSPSFRGHPSKLVNLVKYNEQNLKKKIEQFLKKAEKGIFVKRLPIEFTQQQVEYVEYRQRYDGKKRSFNAAVREIVDKTRYYDTHYNNNINKED